MKLLQIGVPPPVLPAPTPSWPPGAAVPDAEKGPTRPAPEHRGQMAPCPILPVPLQRVHFLTGPETSFWARSPSTSDEFGPGRSFTAAHPTGNHSTRFPGSSIVRLMIQARTPGFLLASSAT